MKWLPTNGRKIQEAVQKPSCDSAPMVRERKLIPSEARLSAMSNSHSQQSPSPETRNGISPAWYDYREHTDT